MNFSKIAVKRPVTTTMIILIAIAFGVLSIFNLKLDMLPNMNMPYAMVSTTYSGVAPQEIQKLVTEPLEGVLGTVPGIKNIYSISSNGSSIIQLEFEDGVNLDNAALDVREKIDMIKGRLPDDATDPMVLKLDMNAMISLSIGVTSDKVNLIDLKRRIEDNVVNRLERQNGVASVAVSGGRESEIEITLINEKLRGYGVTEAQISNLLRSENRNTPAGVVKQGDKDMQIKVIGEFTDLDEIRNLPITTPSNSIIYLRDVAEVNSVYKENSSISYINNTPSVTLSIQKQSTANTVNVSDAVMKELRKIQAENPDLNFKTLVDPANFIKRTLGTVTSSAINGGLIAVFVLLIFLRNIRSTLIVAASMPISIITTFALMYYSNVTLNTMSLGGLALGIGMLVDNSIVVLESIYRKIEEGCDKVTAAIEGAREVAMSVVASTLTTVAVFLPISLAGGISSMIFGELALTVAFSLFSSLAVALTFVPMACALILKFENHKKDTIFNLPARIAGKGIDWLQKFYSKVLAKSLRFPKTTVLISFAFVILTFFSMQFVGTEFMPATDESGVTLSISLPKGSQLEETEAVTLKILDKVKDVPEIVDISYTVGGSQFMGFGGVTSDTASIKLELVDKNSRSLSSEQMAVEIGKMLEDVPGAEITASASSNSMGNFGGAGITLYVKGSDMNTLTEISNDVRDLVATIEGTRDVKTSLESSSPQATVKVDRMKAANYGITPSTIATIVNTAVSGSVATTYKIGGDEFDVRMRQDQNNFNYITDIQNILIPSPTGISVPIYELAEISVENQPISILRGNQLTYISVTAALDNRAAGEVTNDLVKKLATYNMPAGYSWEFAGASEQMMETFAGLALALIMAVFLVYMIMAAEFESLIYPLIVMFSIPIALTGGLFGLFVTGNNLNITGFMGLIMLSGIVINNAIVLIDYTNLLVKERSMEVLEALKMAGAVRLRPILMSVATTVFGLFPMMIATTQGSETMTSLATVVIFGLTLSTLVTLLLIPAIYLWVNNRKVKRKAKKELRRQKKLQKRNKLMSEDK